MAPDGFLWVCLACGKTAADRYGIEGENHPGWDESCSLNSDLFPKSSLVYDGSSRRVVQINGTKP
jgi:hypothetical protein